MQVWIVYDIVSGKAGDRRRRQIVKEIEKFGLIRIQKSIFAGTLDSNRYDELVIFSQNLIDHKKDSVYIFPMCKTDYDNVEMIGLGFDKDLVADKKDNLFF